MKYIVDNEIYSFEALRIANEIIGKIYQKKAQILLKNSKIEIETDDELIFKRLINEALNQQCRIDLLKKTKNLSKMILTKAIISSLERTEKRSGK